MQKKTLAPILAFVLALAGCGSSNSTTNTAPTTASGTWAADLVGGTDAASAISFVTQFTVNANGSLNVTNLTFLTTLSSGSCFPNGGVGSGTLNVTTNNSGAVTGTLDFTVQSNPPGTTLHLTGSENGRTITGKWNLSGNCSGQGTFTMTESG